MKGQESFALLPPLPLIFSTVEPDGLFGVGISGSGAGEETILFDTEKEITRERVAMGHKSAGCIARREVKEPEVLSGVFAYFCHCWQK